MPFWGVVMGVVNIIMGVARGRYHQLPVGVAMVPEGSLKKLEPMLSPPGFRQQSSVAEHFLAIEDGFVSLPSILSQSSVHEQF